MPPGAPTGPRRPFLGLTALCWVLVGLAGCASSSSPVQRTFQAAVAPWVSAWKGSAPEAASATLTPGFDYLRVHVNGKPVWLARGYTDPAEGGPVTVWYSAQSEVLRLHRGRLVGLVGTPVSWSKVEGTASAPLGPELPEAGITWQRRVDQMPGHLWGLSDTLRSRRIAPPTDSHVAGVNPADLVWTEEVDTQRRLPPSRYAWKPGDSAPVYGEQCLKSDFCLAWQLWP